MPLASALLERPRFDFRDLGNGLETPEIGSFLSFHTASVDCTQSPGKPESPLSVRTCPSTGKVLSATAKDGFWIGSGHPVLQPYLAVANIGDRRCAEK
jgi:hypothetical protein